MNIERNITKVLLVLLVAFLAFWAGIYIAQTAPFRTGDMPQEFGILSEAWDVLSDNYVDEGALDPYKMSRGALKGMLDELGDPYTSYIDSYELGVSDLEGSFEGIGALVSIEDGNLTVVSPIAGGPAESQGIRSGDKIVEIDGESTVGMSLIEAVLKIRGPRGTTVTLLILHIGDSEPVEITIVREVIELDSVYVDILPDNIAYVQITHFASDTDIELSGALEDSITSGAEGIILDLRSNPGGYLHVVVNIADEFLDKGVVLYEADDKDNVIEEFKSKDGGLAIDIPLAVLINGGSASGSEVLAGALQDRNRAPLIGTQTFGKGSVNVLLSLSDGSALYITTARWLTPDGSMIEGIGLTPDIEVEITEDDIIADIDPQLDAAINYLQSQ